MLVVTNFRLIIENFLKYGVLLHLPNPLRLATDEVNWPIFGAMLSLVLYCYLCYAIEARMALSLTIRQADLLQTIIIVICGVTPFAVTYPSKADMILGAGALMLSATIVLKLISFAHVLHDVKRRKATGEVEGLDKEALDAIEKYPKCLNARHFVYFLLAPTLCFQFSYPLTPRIRKRWLLKRLIELLLSVSLMVILMEQYIAPLLRNTIPIVTAEEINYFALLERLLKLSLPNLYLWLLMFFSFFHCFLNMTAELLRFGDRSFYQDWWNSLTLGEYWRLWNLPVHNWILRHLYSPLRSVGLDGGQTTYGVFFVSALAHEYIISGSCHVLSVVAFFGMMGQAPMVVRMEWYKKFFSETQIGNVIFWVTFCIIGQPIAVMVYSYQVVKSYSA